MHSVQSRRWFRVLLPSKLSDTSVGLEYLDVRAVLYYLPLIVIYRIFLCMHLLDFRRPLTGCVYRFAGESCVVLMRRGDWSGGTGLVQGETNVWYPIKFDPSMVCGTDNSLIFCGSSHTKSGTRRPLHVIAILIVA